MLYTLVALPAGKSIAVSSQLVQAVMAIMVQPVVPVMVVPAAAVAKVAMVQVAAGLQEDTMATPIIPMTAEHTAIREQVVEMVIVVEELRRVLQPAVGIPMAAAAAAEIV